MRYSLILAFVALPLLGGAGTCFPPPAAPSASETEFSVPYLGCEYPGVLRSAESEVGDYLVVHFAGLGPDDFTRGVKVAIQNKLLCPPNATGDLCKDHPGEVVTLPTGELAPFEVLLWSGLDHYPPSNARSVTVTPTSWGLYTVTFPHSLPGPVSAAFKFNGLGSGSDFRQTTLNMCKSGQITPGVEFWCHDGGSCADMAVGGDSPDPNFVAHPSGIWVWGDGPGFVLDEITYGPDRTFFWDEFEI